MLVGAIVGSALALPQEAGLRAIPAQFAVERAEAVHGVPTDPNPTAPASSCNSSSAGTLSYQNSEHGYCIVHDASWEVSEGASWEVTEDGSASVTFRSSGLEYGARIALNISVAETAHSVSPYDAFALLADWLHSGLRNLQEVERSETLISGLPAKLLEFRGSGLGIPDHPEIVGLLYTLQTQDGKQYTLAFVMDTTFLPVEAYEPTVSTLLASFRLSQQPLQGED